MIWTILYGYVTSYLLVALKTSICVLDPNTMVDDITDQDGMKLYKLRLQFMWLVLCTVFQTASAQSILNPTMETCDPRSVWFEQVAFQTMSEHSRLASISMFSRLHTLEITERKM